MMLRKLGCAAALLLAALPLRAADTYSIKPVAKAPPPKELAEPVRKLMAERAVQLLDAKGQVLVEVWFRKDVPAMADAAKLKKGLTYREVPETTVMGAMRVAKPFSDYRKQKVPPGVYTLRLGFQPMDGDHMGTAPYTEFLLASAAAEDKTPATMPPKALNELSAKVTDNHPAVFLLFPARDATAQPKLLNKGSGHWVLFDQAGATAGGQKASLPIGLTLIGVSTAA